MKFLEKNLEDIVHEGFLNQHLADELFCRGLDCYPMGYDYDLELPLKSYRQLRIGNYGIADIVNIYKSYDSMMGDLQHELTIQVVELKRGKITSEALYQACRYFRGVERYLRSRGLKCRIKREIVLIGDGIETSDWVYVLPIVTYDDVYVYDYKYDYDGISFNHISGDYYLKEEGF